MNVIRVYSVKVHAIGVLNAEPFGETYAKHEISNPARISDAVAECIASAMSDNLKVHSVIVEPHVKFTP